MGNAYLVMGLVFLLGFIRFMIGEYDNTMCVKITESRGYTNYTLPEEETPTQKTDLWSFISGSRCTNIPWYVNFFIYTPILIGIIYLLIPIPFKV